MTSPPSQYVGRTDRVQSVKAFAAHLNAILERYDPTFTRYESKPDDAVYCRTDPYGAGTNPAISVGYKGYDFDVTAMKRDPEKWGDSWMADIYETGGDIYRESWPDDEIPYGTAALALSEAVRQIIETIDDDEREM